MNKNVDRKCCMSSLEEKDDDLQCSASAHLTKDNETESASKLKQIRAKTK